MFGFHAAFQTWVAAPFSSGLRVGSTKHRVLYEFRSLVFRGALLRMHCDLSSPVFFLPFKLAARPVIFRTANKLLKSLLLTEYVHEEAIKSLAELVRFPAFLFVFRMASEGGTLVPSL